MKCKQIEKLPVVNEWQKVLEPDCKHHHHGCCCKLDRVNENDPCPLDNVDLLPTKETTEES